MTRDQIKALENLYAKRVLVAEKLAQLGKIKSDRVECGARTPDGNWQTFYLSPAYLGAQWTVELVDVERRIRAAGGTI